MSDASDSATRNPEPGGSDPPLWDDSSLRASRGASRTGVRGRGRSEIASPRTVSRTCTPRSRRSKSRARDGAGPQLASLEAGNQT